MAGAEFRRTSGRGWLSRRQLFMAAGAGFLLSGCSTNGAVNVVTPTPRNRAAEVFTVSGLLSTTPFHIAHRGSGDNWTEHTAASYLGAVQSGAKAIEVSVSSTSDGVLVCHHDLSTERMTGRNLPISEVTYAELEACKNDARSWIGPRVPFEPIPRLKDVLDAHAPNNVIFIEDKQGVNTVQLLDLMDSYPDSKDHFVWKQTAAGKHHAEAKERGYKTWGYFIDNVQVPFSEYADRFDYLGIYHGATDDEIKALVAIGKPVICWEIHTRWMRERVLALGVQGLMCSNFPYVSSNKAISGQDAFASGVRAAGDLPYILAPEYQPTLQPEFASLSLNHESSSSYTLGSMCPIEKDSYSLSFDMRWPLDIPESGSAGMAFGQNDDQPYRPTVPATVGGYHLTIDRLGTMRLFGRAAGALDGELLQELRTEAPKSGAWMRFNIDVGPADITVRRTDGEVVSGVVANSAYRGGYFGLTKNYKGRQPVEFRQVGVT
jgi:hypothetical protein